MKIYTLIIFLLSVILISCGKAPDIRPNVQTTISGQFYDSFNKEGYADLKIKIGEYQLVQNFLEPSEYNLIGYRDSTTTDANGKYKISFVTSGKGSAYYLEFSGIPEYIYVGDKGSGGLPYGYRRKKIENIGSAAVYDFDILKQYYMKLRVIVHDDPHPPVNVFVGNTHFQTGSPANDVYGKNNDTVEYIQIVKNTGGFNLYFTILDPATNIYYRHPQILLNPVIDKDTIQGGTYTVYPATFK